MDFSDRQQEPGKKFLGIGLVIAFHVVLVYALLNGLGTAHLEAGGQSVCHHVWRTLHQRD
ncbi:hypothetical protein [Undibacterium sp. WLHG33]|uniref:hypothetical protein n=1 Tax=Undibacterium sp. WLHG33 TaxID=3412482 RepID=UPI003C30144C